MSVRKRSLAVVLFGFLTVAAPVSSAESPEPLTPQEAQLGTQFLKLAKQFGFPQLASSSRTATGLQFRYLPEDATLDRWTHQGSVVLMRLGTSWDEGSVVLPRYIAAFRKQLETLNQLVTFESDAGDVTYVDYEVGRSPAREHNLAAIWQAMPGVIAIFQAQRRPERFREVDIDQFKAVAVAIAREPGLPSASVLPPSPPATENAE